MRIKQQTVQVSVLNCIRVNRNKYSTNYKTVSQSFKSSPSVGAALSYIAVMRVCPTE